MDDENAQPPAPPIPPVSPEFPPPTAPAAAAPVAPTISAQPASYPAPVPVPESKPGRTTALVIAIVVGIIVVIGGLGTAIFFVAQSAISTLESAAPELPDADDPATGTIELRPLVEGDTADPVASEPLECADACFSPGVLSLAVPSRDAVQELGLPVVENPLGIDTVSPDTEYTNTSRTWVDGEGEPEECFFTYLSVPIAATLGDRPATSTDPIDFLSYANSADEYSYLSMSSRLFSNSAAGNAHMAGVHALVPGCDEYDIGTGQNFWTADVTPLPALNLPSSVAATGWVEDGPFGRYYVIDLQRGNLVVRSTLGTDGAVTEERFRSFIEDYAVQLSELEQVN